MAFEITPSFFLAPLCLHWHQNSPGVLALVCVSARKLFCTICCPPSTFHFLTLKSLHRMRNPQRLFLPLAKSFPAARKFFEQSSIPQKFICWTICRVYYADEKQPHFYFPFFYWCPHPPSVHESSNFNGTRTVFSEVIHFSSVQTPLFCVLQFWPSYAIIIPQWYLSLKITELFSDRSPSSARLSVFKYYCDLEAILNTFIFFQLSFSNSGFVIFPSKTPRQFPMWQVEGCPTLWKEMCSRRPGGGVSNSWPNTTCRLKGFLGLFYLSSQRGRLELRQVGRTEPDAPPTGAGECWQGNTIIYTFVNPQNILCSIRRKQKSVFFVTK